MLGLLGGLASGLGGLFGNKSSSEESFSRDSTVDQTASAQDLSPELLKQLEGLFGSSLSGGGMEAGQAGLMAQLQRVLGQAGNKEFNVESFVSDLMKQATSGAQLDLESSRNNLLSQAGGASADGNSMAALLVNKMQNATAANLAGVGASARGEGEGILRANRESSTNQIAGLSDGLARNILGVIEATRGANTTGTSKTVEKTTGKGTQSGTSGGGAGGFFKGLGSFIGNMGSAKSGA